MNQLEGLQLFPLIDSCSTLYFTLNFVEETKYTLKKCCSIFPMIWGVAFFLSLRFGFFRLFFLPSENTLCCYTLSLHGHKREACRGAISRLSVGSSLPLSPILPVTGRILNLLKLLGVTSAALSAANAALPAWWALLVGPRIRGVRHRVPNGVSLLEQPFGAAGVAVAVDTW